MGFKSGIDSASGVCRFQTPDVVSYGGQSAFEEKSGHCIKIIFVSWILGWKKEPVGKKKDVTDVFKAFGTGTQKIGIRGFTV